jgi:hypothetical protein
MCRMYIEPSKLSNPNKVVVTIGDGSNNIREGIKLISTCTTDDSVNLNSLTDLDDRIGKIEPEIKQRTQITMTVKKEEKHNLKLQSFKGKDKIEHTFSFPNSNSVHELRRFLNTLETIDTKSLNSGTFNIKNVNILQSINDEDINTMKKEDIIELINKIIKSGKITMKDIDLLEQRKKSVAEFEKLLNDEKEEYINLHNITDTKDEKIWQHFFENNNWIFGLGLSYQFIDIINAEHTVGNGNVDFLCADLNFTVLVEIKKPDTLLFKKEKNRADAWALSPDIFNAKSQLLQYKINWLRNHEDKRNNKDKNQNKIKQRTLDTKCILIIGNIEKELSAFSNYTDKETAEETFEMFRRDSRNIEIITFDELLVRAKFVLDNSTQK